MNLGKAVHIDDAAHLAIAAHIESDPLHPMSGEVFWSERPAPIHTLNQPHLFFFILAGLRAAGGSLLAFHLAIAVFAALALWATWRSALACGVGDAQAIFATAAIGLGPAFAPSQNLMTDVPLLALWMVTLFLLISAQTDRSGGRIGLAGVAIGAACLVKYTSLVLIPLFAWWLWTRHRRLLAAALIPVGTLALWSAFNAWDYGGVHLLEREISVTQLGPAPAVGATFGRAALWVITLGAVAPFTLAFAGRASARFGGRRLVWIAALGLPLIAIGGQLLAAYGPDVLRGETWIHSSLRGLFFLNGVLTIALAISALRRTWHRPTARLLGAWIGAVAVFIVVLSPFVAVRHVLLALPPLLALLLLDPDDRPTIRLRTAGLALSAVIGLGVAVADWRIADLYRDLPAALSSELAGEEHGRVLYLGHWGFQHYAEEAGWVPYVPGHTELVPTDRIVRPAMVDQPPLDADDGARLAVVHEAVFEAGPLDLFRTVTPRLGYYSVWHGLPWTLTLAPLETVEILELLPGAR